MYFNNVNIIYYIIVAISGLFVGEFVSWTNKRLFDGKKILSRDIIKEYKNEFSPNYILMLLTSAIYVAILYKYGASNSFTGTLDLIKYLVLTPMLISVVIIDFKMQIIPNRLNLTMFELGLIFAFLYGFSNVAISINMIIGLVIGGGIFLLITLLSGLVYGKEAMGLGDVKLMGVLGLYLGTTNIIIVALISFLVGAILSIGLLVTKLKKSDEYIPFGPFIVIGTFVTIFVPYSVIIKILLNIFSLGLYSKRVAIKL